MDSRLWPWLAAAAVGTTYLFAERENRYPAALLCAAAFAMIPSLFPALRPRSQALLCPKNWAIFLFFLQLVVLPLSLLTFGPSPGVLPYMPTARAINAAMMLNALGFASFAAGYQYCAHKNFQARRPAAIPRPGNESSPVNPSAECAPARKFFRTYFGLGVLGLFLAFHGAGGLLEYIFDPAAAQERMAGAAHTLPGLLGLLLRPFLGFGFVFLWCNWLDRQRGPAPPRRPALTTVAALVAVLLSYATFAYNRGAFTVPLVAMLATMLGRARWIRLRAVFSCGAVILLVLLLAPLLAVYRNSDLPAGDLLELPGAADFFADKIDLLMTLQMYASGPQYGGFLLEASHWGRTPYLGSTLIPSLLEPLPFLGHAFRPASGPQIYNRMVYGSDAVFDQILPLAGEMFLNCQVPGVVLAFLVLGGAAFSLQRAFTGAGNSIEAYIWQYTAIWVLFLILGSISVLTQILFYFFWPIYGYFWWQWSAGRTRAR